MRNAGAIELLPQEARSEFKDGRAEPPFTSGRVSPRRLTSTASPPARSPGSSAKFPGGRSLRLHSRAHLLITAMTLECSYSSTSIRERIYVNDVGAGTADASVRSRSVTATWWLTPSRALGDQDAVVRATRGDAEGDAALALGIESVAALAEHTLANGSEAERAALLCFKVNSARMKVLREKAAAVRALGTPPVAPLQSTTQRKLDIQEGKVLVLLDILLTAMRAAKKLDAALVMPELGRLRTWFYPPRRKKTEAAKTPTEQPK